MVLDLSFIYKIIRTISKKPLLKKGDYGNVLSDNSGEINAKLIDSVSSLYGAYGIIGRTVVLHQLKDDLGKGGNPDR